MIDRHHGGLANGGGEGDQYHAAVAGGGVKGEGQTVCGVGFGLLETGELHGLAVVSILVDLTEYDLSGSLTAHH